MTTIAGRYDETAEAYLRWWAPVLAPTALRVLDLAAPAVETMLAAGRRPHLVDVGTGAGALAIAAAARWPGLEVTGVDASTGMLDVARGEVERAGRHVAARVAFVGGLADRLPLPDAAADVVVSSFVYQLVPDRGRAVREALRVLRPGGALSFVTWRVGSDDPFAPDQAFFDALDDVGIPDAPSAEEARSGDIPSPEAAAAQARRAGFRAVRARAEWLEHAYEPAAYLDFLEAYAERETFEDLTAEQRIAVRTATLARLARLRPADFVWRAPVVTLTATRPAPPG